ncbi:thioredoxin family protein [Altererythrobacter sp. RZ02]|uniref:Thioredoxin family protein n=1 Tax=Pontixanthobacter rizhaonensis TaxID=2730337 RepID=A0A848QMU4_9SPHN|nr:thioredoxin family protein [Pontixanthobacter rizhaonensis]NMW31937.1 thioredoxin family protein [Pontixanthobacter rizhaonensis]
MKKLLSLFAAIAALFALTPVAAAPAWTSYSDESFARAQNAGKTIIVDVHADWCPTCRAQQPILNELRADKRLKDVVFIKVDFDSDKGFLRANRIPRQSTIVVFKGKKETARSIAETNRKRLRSVVLGAI